VACVKLAPIGNRLAAGYATAKLYKILPADVLAEEGPVFSFAPLYLCPTFVNHSMGISSTTVLYTWDAPMREDLEETRVAKQRVGWKAVVEKKQAMLILTIIAIAALFLLIGFLV
jgi:hypothetical protein